MRRGESIKDAEIIGEIRQVIRSEAESLVAVEGTVNSEYVRAVRLIADSKGKVVTTGMGKSGLVAKKIAATLSSTGTLAVFLHPAEALHGDLGILSPDDVVIALSKSGEGEEMARLLPAIEKIDASLIAVTACPDSTLGKAAQVVLFAGVEREACPYDLAPTSSTTVALAIGDALALTLMKVKDFRVDDFALYHPGGKLGQRLLTTIGDLMIPFSKCATLELGQTSMEDVLFALSEYSQGVILLMNGDGFEGILTDGDVRRLLQKHKTGFFELSCADVIIQTPICVQKDLKAIAALELMENRERPLNVVPVMDGDRIAGIARLHDILQVK